MVHASHALNTQLRLDTCPNKVCDSLSQNPGTLEKAKVILLCLVRESYFQSSAAGFTSHDPGGTVEVLVRHEGSLAAVF